MVTVTQVVVGVVAVAMAYTIFVDYRRRRIGPVALALWEAVWIGLIVVIVVPGPFRPVAHALELPRLLDVIVIGGMVLLTILGYRGYLRLEQLSRRLDRLVSDLAVADFAGRAPASESSGRPAGD